MSAGLQVFNTSGTITIDETYKNHMLRQILPCALPTNDLQYLDVDITANAPIIAVDVSADRNIAVIGIVPISSTRFRVNLACDASNNSGVAILYIFDAIDDFIPSSTGLQVYNSSGQLTFDSTQKYLRVTSFGGSVDDYGPRAVVFCTPGTYGETSPGPDPNSPPFVQWETHSIVRESSGRIYNSQLRLGSAPQEGAIGQQSTFIRPLFLSVDTSGL